MAEDTWLASGVGYAAPPARCARAVHRKGTTGGFKKGSRSSLRASTPERSGLAAPKRLREDDAGARRGYAQALRQAQRDSSHAVYKNSAPEHFFTRLPC